MTNKKDIQDLKDMVVVPNGILHKKCLWVVNGTPQLFIKKLNKLLGE